MTMKRLLPLLLSLCLLLAACGPAAEPNAVKSSENAAPPADPGETVPGFIPSEVPFPEGFELSYTPVGWDFEGDSIWLIGFDADGQPVLQEYNTIGDAWQSYPLDAGGLHDLGYTAVSAYGGAVWALLSSRDSEAMTLDWYLYRLKLDTGDISRAKIEIYGGADADQTEGRTIFSQFSAVISLGPDRALLYDYAHSYLVDSEANELGRPALEGADNDFYYEVDGVRWLYSYASEGENVRRLDEEALTLGDKLPAVYYGRFLSQKGRFLCSADDALCELDPKTGETRVIVKWLDAALSAADDTRFGAMENSEGVIFYVGNGHLVRVTPAMVKQKQPLRLAVFADSSDGMYEVRRSNGEGSYLISDTLRDAIIRFNNTDPDCRIELVPIVFDGEQERNKMLIDLATRKDLDLIDTSLLPEKALDDSVLADLLPYLDADGSISREDFIPTLFEAMQRGGGLYEYATRYTMLGFLTTKENFPGRESWTLDAARALIAGHPEQPVLVSWVDHELLLELLAEMATAEYIDWSAGTCRFDDGDFAAWLTFLKELPNGSEYSPDPVLLLHTADLSSSAVIGPRRTLGGDYALSGFPGTSGTGFYWRRLGEGTDGVQGTLGSPTRVGIMAASEHKDGSWRFVRTLMQNPGPEGLLYGIPVYKPAFEALLKDTDESVNEVIGFAEFTAADAAALRELAYATDKMVRADEELMDIIKTEAQAFLAGQKTADEAARQIQSRVSIYVSEQAG